VDQELQFAPYDVFWVGGGDNFVLPIVESVEPASNLHFIPRDASSWWWNMYVTSFI